MIRTATEKDIVDLAKLMGELGYPTTTKEMEQRFYKIKANPLYHTLVAEIDRKVIGMIGMFIGFDYEKNEDYIRIVALVVDSKYRKQGIGGELIQRVGHEQGRKEISLKQWEPQ